MEQIPQPLLLPIRVGCMALVYTNDGPQPFEDPRYKRKRKPGHVPHSRTSDGGVGNGVPLR
jgi:hypothetical protein